MLMKVDGDKVYTLIHGNTTSGVPDKAALTTATSTPLV